MDWKTLARTSWGRFAIGFGILTAITLLSAMHLYIGQILSDKPISWTLAIRRSSEDWFSMGVLVPVVLSLSRRYQFERSRLRQWLLVHGLGSVIYGLCYISLYAGILDGQVSIEGTTFEFGPMVKKMVVHYLPAVMIAYWLIVFGQHTCHYYGRFRERELRAAELETQLVGARLEALRMQLNPHFLFNTLHTISALVHQNPAAADRTIARLSDLLRLTLDPSETHEVPLKQEIAFLSRFLEIEQTRFEDRLSVEIAVPPEVEDALVPTLILQPLVENAIRHGIEPREAAGKVSIRASRVGERLCIHITDNGPGLAPPARVV